MIGQWAKSVKGRNPTPGIVAIIASLADLRRATRLRCPPDFFELRLDALLPLSSDVERTIARLSRPLIITARHPREGGHNNLSPAQRRQLLLRFLPQAAYVDIELRSTQLYSVLVAAKDRNTKRLISVHDLRRTPPARDLRSLVNRAQELSAEVFKIVTRTDTPDELARLIEFFEEHKRWIPISAMGIGILGRKSRAALMRRGSVLNYAHLGLKGLKGQFSLSEMRRQSAAGR